MAAVTQTVELTRSALIRKASPSSNVNSSNNDSLELVTGVAAGSDEPDTSTQAGAEAVFYLPDDFDATTLLATKQVTGMLFEITDGGSNLPSRPTPYLEVGYADTPAADLPAYNAITWASRPTPRGAFNAVSVASGNGRQISVHRDYIARVLLKNAALLAWLNAPIDAQDASYRIHTKHIELISYSHAPRLVYTYDDIVWQVYGLDSNPAQADPSQDITLGWTIRTYGATTETAPTQASAVLEWTSIADGTSHTIQISGDTSSITIPADTLPSTGVSWSVTATDTDGNTITGAEYTLETGDRATIATPTQPVNGLWRNKRNNIVFAWTLTNALGHAATRSELQWRRATDGEWQTLANVQGSGASYTAAGGTFPGAELLWRVRAYNQDGVAGPWSDAASFTTADPLSVATPGAPKNGAYVNEKAAIQLSWTATNALGYAPQKCDLQYREVGESWTDLATVTEGGRSYSVPANTFPSADLQWRVRAYNDDDAPGDWSDAASYTTLDELTVVTAQSPDGIYCNRTEAVVFRWDARNYTSAITGFDLEYDAGDGEGWQRFAQLRDTSATVYEAEADTFPAAAEIQWRVRGYNDDSVAGSWSALSFATIDAETFATPTQPTNGTFLDETRPIAFSWTTENALGSEPTGAELQWATEDVEASYEELGSVTGPALSFTAPANTFPGAVIYWRVRASNQSGVAGAWGYGVFSTVDTPSVAAPVSPVGVIVNADNDIRFSWTSRSDSGSLPTGADVEYRREGEEWAELGSTDGQTWLDVPGGTLSAGNVYWRVRSYNRNGTPGPWSGEVSFVAYAAPRIIAVFADGMPFTTISWQSDGQLAYEIDVDGKTYGPDFGAGVRSFTMPEPLENGRHQAAVRAQNEFGLWSNWAEISFTVAGSEAQLFLTADGGTDVELRWTGGSVSAPVITVQPVAMATEDGLICFAAAAEGGGLSYRWEILLPGEEAWQPTGVTGQIYTHEAASDYDGAYFRCRVGNAAGTAVTDAVLYSFEDASAAPVITIQPEDAKKNSGMVRFLAGANGSAFRWFRSYDSGGEEDPTALAVTDGEGGVWRIPSGAGGVNDIPVSDGNAVAWHIPAGIGEIGSVGIADDSAGVWYLPGGSGEITFIDTGVTTPELSFPAALDRDGSRYYCRITNAAGTVSSVIVTYTYGEPDEDEPDGDYLVYRDSRLIARTRKAHFTDRTILGLHWYQIIERLESNDAVRSNYVSAAAEIKTLSIAALSGGDWIELRLSEYASRVFEFTKSRQVAYVRYSGARYPTAEVGEQEELSGSFDASFPYARAAAALALEALLGEDVIVKTGEGVVLVGPLEGVRRADREFYRSYTFSIQQTDWEDFVDAQT